MQVVTKVIEVKGLEQVVGVVVTEDKVAVFQAVAWSQAGAISQCLQFINKYNSK